LWFARLRAKGKGEKRGKDLCLHHLEPNNRVGIFLQKMIDVNGSVRLGGALSRKNVRAVERRAA
jgi:hypothetical protein